MRLTEEPEQQGDGRCGLGLKMLREAGELPPGRYYRSQTDYGSTVLSDVVKEYSEHYEKDDIGHLRTICEKCRKGAAKRWWAPKTRGMPTQSNAVHTVDDEHGDRMTNNEDTDIDANTSEEEGRKNEQPPRRAAAAARGGGRRRPPPPPPTTGRRAAAAAGAADAKADPPKRRRTSGEVRVQQPETKWLPAGGGKQGDRRRAAEEDEREEGKPRAGAARGRGEADAIPNGECQDEEKIENGAMTCTVLTDDRKKRKTTMRTNNKRNGNKWLKGLVPVGS
eukprot:gene2860-2843_t